MFQTQDAGFGPHSDSDFCGKRPDLRLQQYLRWPHHVQISDDGKNVTVTGFNPPAHTETIP
jgi:hypothetical protein